MATLINYKNWDNNLVLWPFFLMVVGLVHSFSQSDGGDDDAAIYVVPFFGVGLISFSGS